MAKKRWSAIHELGVEDEETSRPSLTNTTDTGGRSPSPCEDRLHSHYSSDYLCNYDEGEHTSRRRSRSFSYSRRAATLDTYLQSTSGLRLQTDGTCSFLFEQQQFTIETTDDGIIFYASLGTLKELQEGNKHKNLLHLMAAWNEKLKQREGLETSGQLRIDSSNPQDPHVAFIYYGHIVEIENDIVEIENATHFQETLDGFVDDVLLLSDKIHRFKEEPRKEQSNSATPAASPAHTTSDGGNSNTHNAKQLPTHTEAATLAATNIKNKSAKKIFSKMIQSIRPKSNNADSIGSLAFIDPSNPTCAFVMDKNALTAENSKHTNILSRKEGEEKKDDSNKEQPSRSTTIPRRQSMSSIEEGKSNSFSREDYMRRRSNSFDDLAIAMDSGRLDKKKGSSSFHIYDGSGDSSYPSGKSSRRSSDKSRNTSYNHDDNGWRRLSSLTQDSENQIIDKFSDKPAPSRGRGLHQTSSGHHSRRHLAVVAASRHRRKQKKRNSAHNESRGAISEPSVRRQQSDSLHHSNSRMNQSEPILSLDCDDKWRFGSPTDPPGARL